MFWPISRVIGVAHQGPAGLPDRSREYIGCRWPWGPSGPQVHELCRAQPVPGRNWGRRCALSALGSRVRPRGSRPRARASAVLNRKMRYKITGNKYRILRFSAAFVDAATPATRPTPARASRAAPRRAGPARGRPRRTPWGHGSCRVRAVRRRACARRRG